MQSQKESQLERGEQKHAHLYCQCDLRKVRCSAGLYVHGIGQTMAHL